MTYVTYFLIKKISLSFLAIEECYYPADCIEPSILEEYISLNVLAAASGNSFVETMRGPLLSSIETLSTTAKMDVRLQLPFLNTTEFCTPGNNNETDFTKAEKRQMQQDSKF
jgi:hypothetical protein